MPTYPVVLCCHPESGFGDKAALAWSLLGVRDWLDRIAALPGWRSPEAMFSGYPLRY